jgi:uncharacterized protein YegP (UPF0339 family)
MVVWEIFIDQRGLYRAHLRAANGRIVCWTEGYSSKQGAKDAIDFVKIHGAKAPVRDLTR